VLAHQGYCAGVGLLISSPKCCARNGRHTALSVSRGAYSRIWQPGNRATQTPRDRATPRPRDPAIKSPDPPHPARNRGSRGPSRRTASASLLR
jgi:hypothetical protein